MDSEVVLMQAYDGYLECALWASNDESDPSGGEPLDRNYGFGDIDAESLAAMRKDVADFLDANAADVAALLDGELVPDAGYVGHDLWLTRNHHGTGFWDRGFPKDLGDRLTAAAEAMGERHLYVGDDGSIYQEKD